MKTRFRAFIAQTLMTLLVTLFSTTTVFAAMISTEQVREEVASSIMRDQVKEAILRDDVQRLLMDRGVDTEAALARVASMSDAEVSQIHQKIDSLPAAAGPGGVLVAVVLVFVILDIIGVTNVFTFIRSGR